MASPPCRKRCRMTDHLAEAIRLLDVVTRTWGTPAADSRIAAAAVHVAIAAEQRAQATPTRCDDCRPYPCDCTEPPLGRCPVVGCDQPDGHAEAVKYPGATAWRHA